MFRLIKSEYKIPLSATSAILGISLLLLAFMPNNSDSYNRNRSDYKTKLLLFFAGVGSVITFELIGQSMLVKQKSTKLLDQKKFAIGNQISTVEKTSLNVDMKRSLKDQVVHSDLLEIRSSFSDTIEKTPSVNIWKEAGESGIEQDLKVIHIKSSTAFLSREVVRRTCLIITLGTLAVLTARSFYHPPSPFSSSFSLGRVSFSPSPSPSSLGEVDSVYNPEFYNGLLENLTTDNATELIESASRPGFGSIPLFTSSKHSFVPSSPRVSAEGFVFNLESCERVGGSIECKLSVKNLKETRQLRLYTDRKYDSKSIDIQGSLYTLDHIRFGNYKSNYYVQNILIKNTSLDVVFSFEEGPSQVNRLSLIDLVAWSPETGSFGVRFYDVTVLK